MKTFAQIHPWPILVSALLLVGLPSFPSLVFAQDDFSGTGKPTKTKGGGSRGSCPTTGKPLTPLVPVSAPNGGWTVASHPTFWVYSPYTQAANHSIKFVLQDQTGNPIYQTKLSGTGTQPGIIQIALPPKEVPPLELEQVYTWHVWVYCDRVGDRPAMASATVKRIALDPKLKQQLEKATPPQRSQLYATNRIWYDAFTVLAEARLAQSSNSPLTTQWKKLLELPSVGLTPFVSEPLLPCCTPTALPQ